ncbi:MAG: MmcQ/YjbR family DNA-binding protein [Chloroflexi bacterium]|nr:MAG: MmcQ/YjbR family DNA-binding protein [Chloroflexota bacterium]
MVRCLREVISLRTRDANSGSAVSNSAHDAIDSRGQRNLVGIVERPSDPVTVERLRRICLALPEVTEKMSHGEPSWFVGGKQFVTTADHHHDDRLSAWCAAPEGAQEMLVKAAPDRFFRPPYVGHRGWVGVYLDVEVDWEEVGIIVERAYRRVAPNRLLA